MDTVKMLYQKGKKMYFLKPERSLKMYAHFEKFRKSRAAIKLGII